MKTTVRGILVALLLGLICVHTAVADDVFVALGNLNTVHRFTTAGTLLGEFFSPGSGGVSDPAGITFGPDGHLYVAGYFSGSIKRYDGVTGAFLDNIGVFRNPIDVAVDESGFVYVSDYGADKVVKVNGNGEVVQTWSVALPHGLVLNPNTGVLVVTSENTGHLLAIDTTGGGAPVVLATGFALPVAVALGPDGAYYVSDYGAGKIYRVDGSGGKTLWTTVWPYIAWFLAFVEGNLYVAGELYVNVYDGTTGAHIRQFPVADRTTQGIATRRSVPPPILVHPVANAGPDQAIHAGQTVVLDGNGSSDDNTSTEDLVFAWTLVSRPVGSTAAIVGDGTASPSFAADLPGTYVASLIVTDADGLSSTPDSVSVSSVNANPIANAGADQGVFVGVTVQLDGSGSFDPDVEDSLSYVWELAMPADSGAILMASTSATPTFIPDVSGTYTATLTVSDGVGGGAIDSVTISVVRAEEYAATQVVTALSEVVGLPPASVTTQGNRQALQNFLTQAIALIEADDIASVRQKLTSALERGDGCVLRGTPDGNGAGRDWITDCSAQASFYAVIQEALRALSP